MSLDVHLLRWTFARVIARQPQLTRRFYEILFDRYPQVVPLFAGGVRTRQEETLGKALVWLVDHLDDSGTLTTALPRHGAKHVSYGVTDEMYEWVGDALLAALAEAADEDWTPEVAKAWSDAYGAIAALMISGARAEPARVS